MRILMTTMQLDIGGAETHIVELSKALAKCGIEICVASSGGAYVKELEENGIRHFNVPLNSKNPFKMIKAARLLEKIISEYKFDIVHSHARIPSFICGKLRKRLRFPFVTTAHWVFRAGFPWNLLSDWGERSLAVSEDIKQYLIDSYGIDKDDIYITINGIDTEKFSKDIDFGDIKQEFKLSDDKTRIVYVSRMDIDRSLVAHQLIEIAEELYRDFPMLEIIIVGGGNDYDSIKAQAEAVNERIGQRLIITTGARTDINKFTAAGNIFVGVSRAALEAMAAEKPSIIAGNEGYIGIFDEAKLDVSIDTNFCCRGCEQATPQHLAQDVRSLLTERDLEALGKYSRQIIKDKYSVKTMASDAIKMYSSVLTGKNFPDCPNLTPDELDAYALPYGKGIKNDVIISGYYGFKNSGDDATLKAIVDGLCKLSPKIRITVLSKNPKETRRIYKVNAINRINLPLIYRKMKQSSLLISGGGSLIQDITSAKSLSYYLYIIKLAQKAGIKTMLYGNGIGPVLNKDKYHVVAQTLNKVDRITLREPDSLLSLEEMGVNTENAQVTADSVFSLLPKNDATLSSDRKYFCVSVRSWEYLAQDFEDILARACRYIHEAYGLTPIFIPMQPSRDSGICEKILKKASIMSAYLDCDASFEHITATVSKSEFVIGMRLHMLIYSACVGVPVIGLDYDPKIRSMMKHMGQDHSLSVSDLKYEELIALCDEIIKNRDEIVTKLKNISQNAKISADENAKTAIMLLKK